MPILIMTRTSICVTLVMLFLSKQWWLYIFLHQGWVVVLNTSDDNVKNLQ